MSSRNEKHAFSALFWSRTLGQRPKLFKVLEERPDGWQVEVIDPDANWSLPAPQRFLRKGEWTRNEWEGAPFEAPPDLPPLDFEPWPLSKP